MRHHIFADETGCFAFNRSHRSSRYFILCSILTDSPDIGTQLLELRRELAWQGLCEGVFHATTDKQLVRDQVFSLISKMEFRIDATILEKSKSQPQLRVDELRFYKHAWLYHLKYTAPHFTTTGDELVLTAASMGTKKKKSAFIDALNDVVGQSLSGVKTQTLFWSADSDPCLQIADYCAWALSRKWERDDTRSYDLISDKIVREYDLFRRGTVHYY